MNQPDAYHIVNLDKHIRSWLTAVAPDWQTDRRVFYTAFNAIREYLNTAMVYMTVDPKETISTLEDGVVFLSMPSLQALNAGHSLDHLDETNRYLWKKAFLDLAMGLYLQLHQLRLFDNFDHMRVAQLGTGSVMLACYYLPDYDQPY